MSDPPVSRIISHRELRNNSGQILRAVGAGDSFTITNDGEPIAELGPIRSRPYRGLSVQIGDRTRSFRDLVPVRSGSGETIAESLEYLRGDR